MAAILLRSIRRGRPGPCGTLVVGPATRRRFAGQSVSKNNEDDVPPPRRSVESSESKEDNSKNTNIRKPMTIVERIAYFPDAAQKVWADYLLNQNIKDAATTPLNAWAVNHPLKRKREGCHDTKQSTMYPNSNGTLYDENTVNKIKTTTTTTTTRIPWRQLQQQRRIQQELRFIIPVVALCMPPGIGYITMLFAFAAPRQILTRHFFNEYETLYFSQLEYEQRLQEYETLVRHCLLIAAGGGGAGVGQEDWNDCLKMSLNPIIQHQPHQQKETHQQQTQWDAAGPIIDALPLYLRFFSSTQFGSTTTTSTRNGGSGGGLSSTQYYSRGHLSRLAMAGGAVFPSLPAWLCRILCNAVAPTTWLQRRIRHQARIVVEDDESLLLWISQQENDEDNSKNHLEPCWSLTELEVRDACLLRGLPIGMTTTTKNTTTMSTTSLTSCRSSLDIHDMRKCLVNHLNMIASVKQRLPLQEQQADNTDSFGLFTLHLPMIRHFLRNYPSHRDPPPL